MTCLICKEDSVRSVPIIIIVVTDEFALVWIVFYKRSAAKSVAGSIISSKAGTRLLKNCSVQLAQE